MFPIWGDDAKESGKTSFHEKRSRTSASLFFSPCPAIALATADLSLSRKAKKLFYLLLPTFVGNSAYFNVIRVVAVPSIILLPGMQKSRGVTELPWKTRSYF